MLVLPVTNNADHRKQDFLREIGQQSDCLTQTCTHRITCFSSTYSLLMGTSAVVIIYWWLGVWRVSAPRETHPRAQSNEWNIISSIMGFVLLSPSCLNSETGIISTKGWGFYLSAVLFFFLLFCSLFCMTFCFPPLSVSLAVPGKRKKSVWFFSLNVALKMVRNGEKKNNY